MKHYENDTCNDISETSYVLDKTIWDRYEMNLTKKNVIEFLSEYKEAKTISLNYMMSSEGLIASYNFDNPISMCKSFNIGGFSNSIDKKIDGDKIIERYDLVINSLLGTFTIKERQYYDYCLINNNPEVYFREIVLGGLSKHGLLPIKNSCILKIALAFNIAILNNNIKQKKLK